MTPQRVHPCRVVLWWWATLALAACGDGVAPSALPIETLASNLQYPKGLWLVGGSAYLTETAGRNTTFGGRVRLVKVDLGTRLLTPLVDSPVNSDAVVVTANGRIYLGSYQGALPGELGQVSVVDPVSLVETPVTDLAIAVTDMFLDGNGDMYVLGASDDTSAASLYRLPAANYADTAVLKRGLGRARALTRLGTDIYYANLQGVWRLDAAGVITAVSPMSRVTSLTPAGTHLYYADYLGGLIGRIDLQTHVADTIVTGLAGPGRWRSDTIPARDGCTSSKGGPGAASSRTVRSRPFKPP